MLAATLSVMFVFHLWLRRTKSLISMYKRRLLIGPGHGMTWGVLEGRDYCVDQYWWTDICQVCLPMPEPDKSSIIIAKQAGSLP